MSQNGGLLTWSCVALQCALCKIGTTDFKIQYNVCKWLYGRTSS